MISGRPGSGKTFLLSWLHDQLADRLLIEIENFESAENHQTEMELDNSKYMKPTDIVPANYQPDKYTVIPILIRLYEYKFDQVSTSDVQSYIERKILEELRAYGSISTLEELLSIQCSFVFLIDDLDELSTHNHPTALVDVQRFIDRFSKYSNVRFVIAGREVAANRFRRNFREYQVCDVSLEQFQALIEHYVRNAERLLAYLQQPDHLLPFLCTPHFAMGIANYWNDSEDEEFNLGRLLRRLLDTLIYRQQQVENVDRINDLMLQRVLTLESLAIESLRNDGIILPEQIQQSSDLHWQWYQLMELIIHRPLESKFVNKWVLAYFAARHLMRSPRFTNLQARIEFLRKDSQQVSKSVVACAILLEHLSGDSYSELIYAPTILRQAYTELEREWLTWGFVQAIADYLKRDCGFIDVTCEYKPKFMGNRPVDIYAEKSGRSREFRIIWVIECKFRLPPYPKPLEHGYFDQLKINRELIKQQLESEKLAKGNDYQLISILATNGGEYSKEFRHIAREYNLEIWHIDFPQQKLTTRTRVTDSMRKKVDLSELD